MTLYRVLSFDESGVNLEYYGNAPIASTVARVILPDAFTNRVDAGDNFKASIPPLFSVGEILDLYTMEADDVQEIPAPGGLRSDADPDPVTGSVSGASEVSDPDAGADGENATELRPTSEGAERTVHRQLEFDL
ncbi:hypothetical protein [Plectonema phage JingP1]|uniref:Uncharacterized protein n=1 Tax=Plectonema phage JingP1 TaxID=2961687 RepID=A0A9E7NMX0_9CAUD|nr:hypothetical protein [Plectonema phage JingP1]